MWKVGGHLRVGIPRGLFWYYDPDAYKIFWETLGFEVVQSPPTNRGIFESGLRFAHEELCLPVKAFHGHIRYLSSKVDFIFIPRIVSRVISKKKRYGCPKFIGLPELIKSSVPDLPPIITIDIVSDNNLEDSYRRLKTLGIKPKMIDHALKKMNSFQKREDDHNQDEHGLRVGVVGHPYLIYDRYLSCNLLDKLEKLGLRYTTSADISKEIIEAEIKREFDLFWIYERELVGAASYFASCGRYHGILHCISFCCGAGSIMGEMIQRRVIDGKDLPLFTLVLDENTGDAGLLTRLEAFSDMIRLKFQ